MTRSNKRAGDVLDAPASKRSNKENTVTQIQRRSSRDRAQQIKPIQRLEEFSMMISAPTLSSKQKAASSGGTMVFGNSAPNPMAPIENTRRRGRRAGKQPEREQSNAPNLNADVTSLLVPSIDLQQFASMVAGPSGAPAEQLPYNLWLPPSSLSTSSAADDQSQLPLTGKLTMPAYATGTQAFIGKQNVQDQVRGSQDLGSSNDTFYNGVGDQTATFDFNQADQSFTDGLLAGIEQTYSNEVWSGNGVDGTINISVSDGAAGPGNANNPNVFSPPPLVANQDPGASPAIEPWMLHPNPGTGVLTDGDESFPVNVESQYSHKDEDYQDRLADTDGARSATGGSDDGKEDSDSSSKTEEVEEEDTLGFGATNTYASNTQSANSVQPQPAQQAIDDYSKNAVALCNNLYGDLRLPQQSGKEEHLVLDEHYKRNRRPIPLTVSKLDKASSRAPQSDNVSSFAPHLKSPVYGRLTVRPLAEGSVAGINPPVTKRGQFSRQTSNLPTRPAFKSNTFQPLVNIQHNSGRHYSSTPNPQPGLQLNNDRSTAIQTIASSSQAARGAFQSIERPHAHHRDSTPSRSQSSRSGIPSNTPSWEMFHPRAPNSLLGSRSNTPPVSQPIAARLGFQPTLQSFQTGPPASAQIAGVPGSTSFVPGPSNPHGGYVNAVPGPSNYHGGNVNAVPGPSNYHGGNVNAVPGPSNYHGGNVNAGVPGPSNPLGNVDAENNTDGRTRRRAARYSKTPRAEKVIEPDKLEFYAQAPNWTRILKAAKLKIRRWIATEVPFPSRDYYHIALQFIMDSLREHQEAGGLVEDGYLDAHRDDMQKLVWDDISAFRGEIKTIARDCVKEYNFIPTDIDPESEAFTNQIAQNVVDFTTDSFFLQDGVDENGSANNFCHPVFCKVLLAAFYANSSKLGIRCRPYFEAQVPRFAMTLVATAIRCAFDEWRSGSRARLRFTYDDYHEIHDAMVELLVNLEDVPHQAMKLQDTRQRLARLGLRAGINTGGNNVNNGFAVAL